MDPDQEECHVRIHSFCGACGYAFRAGQDIAAIHRQSNGTFRTTDAASFPNSAYCEQQPSSGYVFCRFPTCCRCKNATESATLHKDCLSLFILECSAKAKLSLLWTAACWKYPWRGFGYAHLTPSRDMTSIMSEAIDTGAALAKKFLPEITTLIWDRVSQDSLWYQLTSARYLAQFLSAPHHQALQSVPLVQIEVWRRGQSFSTWEGSTMKARPIIRLVLDSDGLSRIDRLASIDQGEFSCRHHAFAVINVEDCPIDVTALFLFGLCRLRLPPGFEGLVFWDKPRPPPLRECSLVPRLAPRLAPPVSRVFALETASCTGITFFISAAGTLAIHAHTRVAPCAMSTYSALSTRHQNSVSWVYTPIPHHDKLEAIALLIPRSGRSHKYCYLFRMALSGDVILGPCRDVENSQEVFSTGPRHTFIYAIPEIGEVRLVGVYPLTKGPGIFTGSSAPRVPSPFPSSACFSSASLGNVSWIQVFDDTETQLCQGFLIGYENGSQRAIGQCRVGWERPRTCVRPAYLCWVPVMYRIGIQFGLSKGMKVQPTRDEMPHSHDGHEWLCHRMQGKVECWFTKTEMVLSTTD